jgi:hypothetical protein
MHVNQHTQAVGEVSCQGSNWNRNKVEHALQFLEPQQAIFLQYLTELLNTYNKGNRVPAYYDLLCGEWLMQFSHVVYAAYIDVLNSPTLLIGI